MATQVKGTAVLASIRFIKEKFGEEGLQKVVARLSPEDQARLESLGLASAWYPIPFLLDFMRAAKAEFGGEMPDLAFQMGRASADYAHTTVYKLVFKLGSPQWIISKASVVFSSYYDQGKMVVIDSGKGFANVELQGFGAPGPEFCDRIAGWIIRTWELCGALDTKLPHTKCTCRGDAVCRFEGKWD